MATEMLWKKEDLREIDWVVDTQIKSALSDLKKEVLYTKNWNEVKFDVETSLNYLKTLKDKKSYQEVMKQNSWATIMAIQILLKNKWYDVGKIDGILIDTKKKKKWMKTSKTIEGVKDFQKAYWLKEDGLPWPETIKKIIEVYENWWWNAWWGVDKDKQRELTQEEYDALCEKTSLTVDEAKQVVKYAEDHGYGLYLDWLTSIDKEVAAELAKFGWKDFTLDWLTSIDKEVAAELAKFKWNELYLGWLTSIDKEVAAELAKFGWKDFTLDWLTSIDKEVAAELAKFKWNELYLDWLTSIDKEVATELAKFGWKIYMEEFILTSKQKEILKKQIS